MGLTMVGGITRYARSLFELVGNRRSFPRTPVSGTILVTTKGYAIDTVHSCSCVDASLRGLGVDCPEPLAVDAFVHIQSEEDGPRRLARVRYCRENGDSYRIGLQFEPR